jgi:benzoyl-CoA reductase/2-hydroxyglutaryl-CoA dehydratase subunit BcrC/BadD/HgdB
MLDNRLASKAFSIFSQAASSVMNPSIEAWRSQGGKVVGYLCSAFPGEVGTAAGILPVRLRAPGSRSTEFSDSFLSPLNCSFPRHVFNMALSGGYDFIDGMVLFNSCDHIRRVYDHWIRQLDTPFVEILSWPKKARAEQVEWFRGEFDRLRTGIERHFGVEVRDDALQQAIALHNKGRRLLREIYATRKSDAPPITGAEMLTLTVASTAMPQAVYNERLEEFLAELKSADGITGYRARVMLLGGELDNPDLIDIIESQGALVVTDSLCFGSRLLWADVEEDTDDPLLALAQYYLADRPACARMFTEYDRRAEYIRQMLAEFKVDGAIFERLAFCELYGFEQFSLTRDFEEWNVPLLSMDREYTLGTTGQLRTRVQAFLERMES